ncbi:MAG: hypothetical protein ACI9FJ_000768 [Alteromonadaceae bacterium]
MDSLSRYVFTEAPLGWAPQAEDEKEILERVNSGPLKAKGEIKQVAALFRTITAILSDPQRLSDDDFDAARFPYQANWGAWGRNQGSATGFASIDANDSQDESVKMGACPTDADVIIIPVATRDEAIDALRMVAEQGEDPSGEGSERSHFSRFKQIYKQYKQHFPEDGEAKPIRDLPVNPTTFRNTRSLGDDVNVTASPITNSESAKWATLFDLRYRLLLTYLIHSFRLARSVNPNKGPGTYQKVMHQAFCEMYNLKAISDILIRRPLNNGVDMSKDFQPAGPPFQMPYTMELPEGEVGCWMQYRDILGGCEEIRAWLEDWESATTSRQEVNYLTAMSNADSKSLVWIDTVLEATRIAGSLD